MDKKFILPKCRIVKSKFYTFDNIEKKIYRPHPGEIISLNALKFICALMVTAIHIPFFISDYISPIYSIAVPIFFMISGYFLVNSKGIITINRINETFKKLLTLTIIANLFYFITNLAFSRGECNLDLFNTIFIGSSFCGALWYLNAMLEVLIVYWILVKLNKTKLIPYLIILGLITNLVIGSYQFIWYHFDIIKEHNFFPFPATYSRNFFTTGLPFVSIGVFIRIKESTFDIKKITFILVLMIFLCFVETWIFKATSFYDPSKAVLLLTAPLSIIVFLMALNIKKNNNLILRLGTLGKKYSTNLYIFHIFTNTLLLTLVIIFNIDLTYKNIWLLPTVIILTILLSLGISRIKKITNKYTLKINKKFGLEAK